MVDKNKTREQALRLCERAIAALEQDGFGERTIKLTARDGHVTFVEVTATQKHKLD